MADYLNPFSAIDPSAYGVGHTALEMVAAQEKAKQAQPFIDLARQQQELELQQKQQSMQEFMSPEAVRSRMLGYGAKSAEAQQTIDISPSETAKKISDAKEAIRKNPALTDKAIAEAELAANAAHSAPANSFINSLGSLGQQWQDEQTKYGDKIPAEFLQAKHEREYNAMVAQHHLQFPNAPLPPSLQKYSSDTETHALAARYTNLHQQDLAAKQRIAETSAGATVEGHRISAGATIEAQRLAQAGATERIREQLPPKEEAANIKREEAITRAITNDPYLKSLQIRLMTADPKDLPALRREVDARIAQKRQEITGKTSGTTRQPSALEIDMIQRARRGEQIPGWEYTPGVGLRRKKNESQ